MLYLHYKAVADTQFATFILGHNFVQSQIHLQNELPTWVQAPRRQKKNIIRTTANRSCGDWKKTFRKNSHTISVICNLAVICSTCEIIFTPTPIVSSRSEQLTFRHFTERKYLLKHGSQGGVRDTVVVKGKHSICHVHLWSQLATTSLPCANFSQWRSKCTAKHALALSTQFLLGTPGTSFPTSHWSYFICSCRSISFLRINVPKTDFLGVLADNFESGATPACVKDNFKVRRVNARKNARTCTLQPPLPRSLLPLPQSGQRRLQILTNYGHF